jgi:uncharacterized membrane protein
MNKMLVAVFDNETAAFDGLSALRDLHRDGDVTLYAWAVIVKDRTGMISVKQALEEGGLPLGAALGLLTGKLLKLLRGPAGLAIGASLPGLTGFLFDLDMSRIGPTFLYDVAKALTRGKAAVLAEVEEGSTTRVDARLRRHGGMVFRRLPAEVIETQLIRQSAAFKAKLNTLTRELTQALSWNRAAIQKDIEQVRKQLNETQDQSKARRDQANAKMGAKLKVLQDQAKGAGDRAKARIERRISDLKKKAADAAADPVTKAKFEQEQHQWLLRAEQAVKAERNLMTRPSREGRLRKPALPPGR